MRILSLSGGGIQGYYTALCLSYYEACHGPLLRHFDLFAGTSAGAMIASAACMGVPMTRVANIFRNEGPSIFPSEPAMPEWAKGWASTWAPSFARDLLRNAKAAKHDGKHLHHVVNGVCGSAKLVDAKAGLMITATRLRQGDPVIFSDRTTPDMLISDVVMASAAAPMLFPARKVGGEFYADGAIFANTPDLIAIDHALSVLGVSQKGIRMLSVGAMNLCPPLREPASPNMGILAWLHDNRIFRSTMAAQSTMTARIATTLLGNRYHRIDAPAEFPGRNDVGLDVVTPDAFKAAETAAQLSQPEIAALQP